MSIPRNLAQERTPQYGPPETTFEWIDRTADSWKHLAVSDLTPGEEHCLRQILMKLTRMRFSPDNPDHLLDIAGYAQCWAQILAAAEED